MSMKIVEYEIIDHGIEHEQYFQGCGVSFTKYTECYTGIGNTRAEALEDAIEQAVTSGMVFTNEQTQEIQEEIDRPIRYNTVPKDQPDHWYYMSIRVKTEE